ncbi:MAG: hypothetical protein EXX96DRAFT_459602, partial [Benjaminiella poitrasii]
LLAVLRLSDLQRISLSSTTVDATTGTLSFDVVAPKEKQNNIAIIKSFTIYPSSNTFLCPVVCFHAVRDHPAAIGR